MAMMLAAIAAFRREKEQAARAQSRQRRRRRNPWKQAGRARAAARRPAVNYEVNEKKGASVRVSLREAGEGLYEITLDGKTVHVDAVRSGPNVYSIIEDGQQFEAMVDEKGAHGFDVQARRPHLPSRGDRRNAASCSRARPRSSSRARRRWWPRCPARS